MLSTHRFGLLLDCLLHLDKTPPGPSLRRPRDLEHVLNEYPHAKLRVHRAKRRMTVQRAILIYLTKKAGKKSSSSGIAELVVAPILRFDF